MRKAILRNMMSAGMLVLTLSFAHVGSAKWDLNSGSGDWTRNRIARLEALGSLFVVDSTGDGDDTVPGDGLCDDGTGHCTLRAAIEEANANAGDDIIQFSIPTSDPGYNPQTMAWTITLPRALPDLSTSMALEGPGAGQLTVSGGNAFRIFNVTTTGTVSFSGMTIANGVAPDNGNGGGIQNVNGGTMNLTNCVLSGNSAFDLGGGGIYSGSGTVTVINSTISGNGANGDDGHGGGIYNGYAGTLTLINSMISNNYANGDFIGYGGGIYNEGTLTVTDSTISQNGSAYSAGGIYNVGTLTVSNSMISGNEAYYIGGGIDNEGTLTVTDSTISGNIVDVFAGGGIYGSATIINSTLSYNFADAEGGGIYGSATITDSTLSYNFANDLGGGISGSATIANSTISGNGATRGGGIYGDATIANSTLSGNTATDSGGGIYGIGQVTVTNSTLSGNSANYNGGSGGTGGGIYGPATIKSTIIALNTADNGSGPDVWGTFTSQGFNLVGKTDGNSGFTQPTDQTGTITSPLDPKLDPNGLQNNGGPTLTIALLPTSPAIDKGTSNGLTGNLTTDQRGTGFARTFDDPATPNATGGDGTDIGSFELQTAAPPPTPSPTATPTATATATPTATAIPTPTSTPPPTATPCQTPAAPTNLGATAISSSQIALSWTDNSNNETGFRIQRSPNGVTFRVLANVGANVITYTDTGLTPGTTYYYRMGAFNACGHANNETAASATTLP